MFADHRMRGFAFLLTAVLAATVAMPALATAPTTNPLALTGTDGVYGPGQGAGVSFGTLDGQPCINASGQVAFRGNNTQTGTPQGMWVFDGGVNNNIALGGQPMPGGGTYAASNGGSISLGVINSMLINNAGQTAFRLGSSYGLFSNTGSGMGRTMLTLDVAPGTGNATYASSVSGMPFFNSAGQSAYFANLTTGTGSPPVSITSPNTNSVGLWIGTSSTTVPNPNVVLALRQNQPLGPDNSGGSNLPGLLTPSDPNYDATGNTRLGAMQAATFAFNGNSSYALVSQLQGTNVITSTSTVGYNRDIVASNRGGSFGIVARANSPAVDATGAATPNTLWRTFGASQLAFNDLGHMGFTATLKTNGTTASLGTGLYTDQGSGTLRQYAFQGTAMPAVYTVGGAPAGFTGVNWGSSYTTAVLTSSDKLIFSASGLTGGDVTGVGQNDTAIFSLGTDGLLHKLMRTYEAVPVFTQNLDAGEYGRCTSLQSSIAANSLGQIAFYSIIGSSLGSTGHISGTIGNNAALFATDLDGTIYCIAQKGESFFAPGMAGPLVVASIGFSGSSGGQEGRAIAFNDNGDLAYILSFTDGSSGLFVSHIPEPGTLALIVISLVAVARRRW
jgi:hypothetical protein